MKVRKPVCASARGLYLSIVSVFGFFLASSAPHRVHHLFERFPVAEHSLAAKHGQEHAHGAEHEDSEHQTRPTPQPPDCFVLSIAQNAHASVVDAFAVVVVERRFAVQGDQAIAETQSFNPSPFSQRAPPLA
jgi:hypothetical protein